MKVNDKTWNTHRWLAKPRLLFGSNPSIASDAAGNSSQIDLQTAHVLSSSGNRRLVGGEGFEPAVHGRPGVRRRMPGTGACSSGSEQAPNCGQR